MKRKHVKTLLAGIMMSSLLCPMLPTEVKAEEWGMETPITNTTEFLEAFAIYTSVVYDEFGNAIPVPAFFTEVNRDNYGIFLLGKQVFDQLPEDVRLEIDMVLAANIGIPYSLMAETALAINAEIIAEQEAIMLMEAEVKAPEEDFVGPVLEETPIEESKETTEESTIQNEEQGVEESSNEEAAVQQEEAILPEKEDSTESAEQEEAIEVKDEIPVVEALFNVDPLPLDGINTVEEELISPASLVAMHIEEVDESISAPVIEKVNVFTVLETQDVPVSATAQSFVNTYCTMNGSIIQNATTGNYQQILSGYSSWQALSTSQKNEVNQTLTKAGGRTYTSLYNAAQAINGTATISIGGVHTSIASRSSLYATLCSLSIALFVFLFKRREN